MEFPGSSLHESRNSIGKTLHMQFSGLDVETRVLSQVQDLRHPAARVSFDLGQVQPRLNMSFSDGSQRGQLRKSVHGLRDLRRIVIGDVDPKNDGSRWDAFEPGQQAV